MSKVFIFGIDGMDKDFLMTHRDQLPNFSSLLDISDGIELKSVHPPDSHTAWASIYTGLNPAQHGIVDFVDPLEKSKILSTAELDNSAIKGKTFWDIASADGKKVCVVLPHLGFPTWEVNGVMIGKSTLDAGFNTYPNNIKDEYDFINLNGLKGFPNDTNMEDYILQAKKLIREEYKFTIQMMDNVAWDLCFTYSSSLDWIEHYFWNHYKKGTSKYKNIILDFYKEHDNILGKYLEMFDLNDTTVLVVSDHGHGLRPLKVVNLNEVLRQNGLLKSNIKAKKYSDPIYTFEKCKKMLMQFIIKFNLGNIAQKMLVCMPSARKMYTTPISINWKDTIAYISDLSGIKAYSYGGIRIVKQNLNGLDYDDLCESIINKLLALKDPESNTKIVKWVKRREELYEGEYIDRYPDLIFDLNDEYGAGWGLYDNLITNAPMSNLVPGSHKIDSAVFLASRKITRNNLSLMDISSIVNDFLNEGQN